LTFWKETIIDASREAVEASVEEEDELEIDELTILFIHYMRARKPSQKNVNNLNITDELMHGLVKHFFSEIQIEDDKYIMNVASRMWNKKKEIKQALLLSASMASSAIEAPSESVETPHSPHQQLQVQSPHAIYNAYERYCAYSYSHKAFVVSKRYFEKYYDEIMN
jgi:hypothetical protein